MKNRLRSRPFFLRNQQVRRFQHIEMLHHTDAREIEVARDEVHVAAGIGANDVEDGTPRLAGHGVKQEIELVIIHK